LKTKSIQEIGMIQIILVIAIIVLILAYFIDSIEPTMESFTATRGGSAEIFEPMEDIVTRPHIEDTDPSDVQDENDDPRDIPWIASWSSADRIARRGQRCSPLHQEEGEQGTMILTTYPSCEDGMAHTRPGGRIVLSDSTPVSLREPILQHEMIHIHQRRNPYIWKRFYRQNWSFQFHSSPHTSIPKTILHARRSNPDTWDMRTGGPWPCWKSEWWPVPIYKDVQSPRLRDAITIWWNSNENKLYTTAPPSWAAFFGTPSQDEHPHEIAACLLVEEDTSSEAGRRLLQWWSTTAQRNSKTDE
jgi:hypothetical protein